MATNRRIVLVRYFEGHLTTDDLRLEEVAAREPGEGEVLCRTIGCPWIPTCAAG